MDEKKEETLTNSNSHSLADLIVALSKLSPCDEEAINAIFEILGIRFEPEVKKPLKTITESSLEINEKQSHKESEYNSPSSSHETYTASDKPIIPSTLVPLEKSQTDYPEWFYNPLSLKNRANSSGPFTSYPLQTLLTPNWTRAILVSALAIYENFGPVNIDEIVRLISLNEPLREIPRLPLPTMVNGVQILIDDSEALEPFYKDQIKLITAVRKIAGSDRTQILRFVGCPSRGVQYDVFDDFSDYYPPSNKTTVLLITDLGILRDPHIIDHSEVSEWLRFASIVRRAGCSLVAFVPYPRERWPKPLQDAMKIIQWDRTTSTSTIQKVVKKALQVSRGEFG